MRFIYLDKDGTARDSNSLELLGHWFEVDLVKYFIPLNNNDYRPVKKQKI